MLWTKTAARRSGHITQCGRLVTLAGAVLPDSPDAVYPVLGRRPRLRLALECPRCGRTGHIVWQAGFRKSQSAAPDFLSAGFHVRASKPAAGASEIVCDRCGAGAD